MLKSDSLSNIFAYSYESGSYHIGPSQKVLHELEKNRLVLSDQEIEDEDIDIICQFLNKQQTIQLLTSIEINRSTFTKDSKRRLGNSPSALAVGGYRLLKQLINFIEKSKKLYNVSFESVKIPIQAYEHLGRALENTTSGIRWLSFKSCTFGDEAIKILTPYISRMQLQVIAFENCQLSDQSLPYIASILKAQQSLMDSLFWRVGLRTDSGVNDTSKNISNHQAIHGSMDPDIDEEFREVYNSGLIAVSLYGNLIKGSKHSLEALTHAIQGNHWLLGLNLANNLLSRERIVYLVEELTNNSQSPNENALLTVLLKGNPGFDSFIAKSMIKLLEKTTYDNYSHENNSPYANGHDRLEYLLPELMSNLLSRWIQLHRVEANARPRLPKPLPWWKRKNWKGEADPGNTSGSISRKKSPSPSTPPTHRESRYVDQSNNSNVMSSFQTSSNKLNEQSHHLQAESDDTTIDRQNLLVKGAGSNNLTIKHETGFPSAVQKQRGPSTNFRKYDDDHLDSEDLNEETQDQDQMIKDNVASTKFTVSVQPKSSSPRSQTHARAIIMEQPHHEAREDLLSFDLNNSNNQRPPSRLSIRPRNEFSGHELYGSGSESHDHMDQSNQDFFGYQEWLPAPSNNPTYRYTKKSATLPQPKKEQNKSRVPNYMMPTRSRISNYRILNARFPSYLRTVSPLLAARRIQNDSKELGFRQAFKAGVFSPKRGHDRSYFNLESRLGDISRIRNYNLSTTDGEISHGVNESGQMMAPLSFYSTPSSRRHESRNPNRGLYRYISPRRYPSVDHRRSRSYSPSLSHSTTKKKIYPPIDSLQLENYLRSLNEPHINAEWYAYLGNEFPLNEGYDLSPTLDLKRHLMYLKKYPSLMMKMNDSRLDEIRGDQPVNRHEREKTRMRRSRSSKSWDELHKSSIKHSSAILSEDLKLHHHQTNRDPIMDYDRYDERRSDANMGNMFSASKQKKSKHDSAILSSAKADNMSSPIRINDFQGDLQSYLKDDQVGGSLGYLESPYEMQPNSVAVSSEGKPMEAIQPRQSTNREDLMMSFDNEYANSILKATETLASITSKLKDVTDSLSESIHFSESTPKKPVPMKGDYSQKPQTTKSGNGRTVPSKPIQSEMIHPDRHGGASSYSELKEETQFDYSEVTIEPHRLVSKGNKITLDTTPISMANEEDDGLMDPFGIKSEDSADQLEVFALKNRMVRRQNENGLIPKSSSADAYREAKKIRAVDRIAHNRMYGSSSAAEESPAAMNPVIEVKPDVVDKPTKQRLDTTNTSSSSYAMGILSESYDSEVADILKQQWDNKLRAFLSNSSKAD